MSVKEEPHHVKPAFRDVYLKARPNYERLSALVERDGLSQKVIHRMITGNAVTRMEAEKVLIAFYEDTGRVYGLDDVNIVLLSGETRESDVLIDRQAR